MPDVSYIEIGTGDVAKSRDFIARLFGWDFHPVKGGPQGWFQTPSMRAGLHGNDPTPGIYVFFGVPDVDAAVAKVKELGGEAGEMIDEPGFGRFSMCRDPQGIHFGLHQK